jgi:hypothetical protein
MFCNFAILYLNIAQLIDMRRLHFFFFLACIFVNNTYQAQEFVRMNHAFHAEIGLPIAVYNPAFKEFIQGVATSNILYQYRLRGNDKFSPTIGFVASVNYLEVANFKIVGLNQGGLFSYGGGLSIGAEYIHDETLISNLQVRGGYYLMESRNKQTPDNIAFYNRFGHLYIEPNYGLTVMLDDRQGFTFNVSYTFRDLKFDRQHLMINELPGFSGINQGGISGHLNFSFGYKLFLQKPSKTLE